MKYIRVTNENLDKEHICCAISNNKDVQVSSKKAWLSDRFEEVLRLPLMLCSVMVSMLPTSK